MIQAVRYTGIALMMLGIVILISWAFEPIRALWPVVLALPLPVRLGLIVAGLGLAILFGSLIAERLHDRNLDRSLRDDD